MEMNVEVEGVDEAVEMLEGIAERATNPEVVFDHVAEDFQAQMEVEFASEGAHGDQAWAPLTDPWLERKRAQGLSTRILEATGALRDSLTGGSGFVADIEDDNVELGTDVAYFRFVHGGTRDMPARPIVLSEDVLEEWIEKLSAYVMEGEEP